MSTRYILNTLALVGGVVLIVASRVFTGGSLEWIGFGISAAVVVLAAIGLTGARLRRHIAGYSVLGALGAWSLVAALVFTGSALGWLVFTDAVAVAAAALTALAIHEVTTERVVHTLEVSRSAEQDSFQTV